MDKKDKLLSYSLIGMGAIALTAVIFKARKARAKGKDRSPIPRKSNSLTIKDISSDVLTNPDVTVPAVFMSYDPSNSDSKSNNIDEIQYKLLNFTPRRASTPHNESEYNDLMYLNEPREIPAVFDTLTSAEKHRTLHPNDFTILKLMGLIPPSFPLSQTGYIKSFNGENEFFVGYSKPQNVTYGKGTNPQTVKAVAPLWAVSFGNRFNTDSKKPSWITKDSDFEETAHRVLMAEFMLARNNEGCDYRLGHNMCAAEKNLILGILLERYKLKKAKDANMTFHKTVVKHPMWSAGSPAFEAGYRGHPGKAKRGLRTLSYKDVKNQYPKMHNRFLNHYANELWHLPNLAGHATNFVHYDVLSSGPDYYKDGALKSHNAARSPESTTLDYTQKHPVRIGRAMSVDLRVDF